jgi:hypothetical protein
MANRQQRRPNRLVIFIAAGCWAIGARAHAQVGELTGAVTNAFLQGEYETRHHVGWEGTVAVPLTARISIVGETSGNYNRDRFDDSFRFFTLLAGPKFTQSASRVRPFIQLPLGLVRTRTIFRGVAPLSYADNQWLFNPGGGVDVPVAGHLAVRVAADWLIPSPQYSIGWRTHNVRVATGITYLP